MDLKSDSVTQMSVNSLRKNVAEENSVTELLALRSAPVGVAVTSLAGSLQFANETFGRLFDVDVASCAGADIHQVFRGLLPDNYLMAVARGGGPRHTAISDDQGRSLLCTATPVMHGGLPIYISLVVQDVSEIAVDHVARWQLVREVLRSHEIVGLWHWIVHITDGAVVDRNPLQWTSPLDGLFGANDEPKSLGDLVQRMKPDCRKRFVDGVSNASQAIGADYFIDYELVGRDGTIRRMRSVGRCVADSHSPHRRLVGFELELNGNQPGEYHDSTYLKLLEHMDVPVASIDGNLRYRYFNPAFAALFENSSVHEPKLDQQVLSAIHDPTLRRSAAVALERATKGYPSTIENEIPDEHGEVRQWVDFHCNPTRDASGAIDGTLVVGHDVSQLKRMTMHHKSLGAELRRGLDRRAAKIDAANRDLSNRVAIACDELRANLERIKASVDGSVGSAPAKEIIAACGKIESSIAGLAQLSSIGLRRLELRKIDMNRLVKEVQHDLGHRLEGRSIEFDVSPLPHVESDRALVKQVLQNLLDNAIKFTRDSPHARIRIWTTVENGVTVWSVADNGVGFDVRDAAEMFNPFAGNREKPPGAGLGIAWRAVQQLDGRLWCESKPGSGAVFHFTLEKS